MDIKNSAIAQTPILLKKANVRKCSILCNIKFNYTPDYNGVKSLLKDDKGKQVNIVNLKHANRYHLEIKPKYKKTPNSQKFDLALNNIKYKVSTFTIHSEPLHRYSDPSLNSDAEIAILHQNISDSSDYLLLCIGINKTGTFSRSADHFAEWITSLPKAIDLYDDRIVNISDTWKFSDIIPERKSFYLYKGKPVFDIDGVDSCIVVVMEQSITMAAAEYERMQEINSYIGQNPRRAEEADDDVHIYYNDGLNIEGHRSLGEIDIVCEPVEKTESDKPKKTSYEDVKTPKIPNFLSSLYVVGLLLGLFFLMKAPFDSARWIRSWFPWAFMTFVGAIYIVVSFSFFLIWWVLLLVWTIIPHSFYVIGSLINGSAEDNHGHTGTEKAKFKYTLLYTDSLNINQAIFDILTGKYRGGHPEDSPFRHMYDDSGNKLSEGYEREEIPIMSSNAPYIIRTYVALITMIIFVATSLLILGVVRPPDMKFKQFVRAGTDFNICKNVVRYADAGKTFPLDDCVNSVTVQNYIDNPECAHTIRSRYQNKRLNAKKYANTYLAITNAIKDGMTYRSADGTTSRCGVAVRDMSHAYDNYTLNGYTYRMCDLMNALRGTNLPCNTVSLDLEPTDDD